MANRRRGEVDLILDGKIYQLCLTFGALAELEDSMKLDNISQIGQRFSSGKVRSADLIKILGAGLRGGGADISDEMAASMRCDGGASVLTAVLVELLQLTFNPITTDPKAS